MTQRTAGIHHITAFVGNAQANVDFYAGVLGLRLVKQTINFDAPEVYHFYFGNETGAPGTIMTFFPFGGGRKGRVGGGQVGVTTYAVPTGTMPFWEERLAKFAIPFTRTERFGEAYLRFEDTDGLLLELVEREDGPNSRWSFGGVSAARAIKGFGGAVLYSMAPQRTIRLLEDVLGLDKTAEEDGWVRYRSAGEIGNFVDVNTRPMGRGQGGTGTVHHIAWRAADRDDQEAWRRRVIEAGFEPTPIVDRNYFTSIYFREDGEILNEIATDPPGFTLDEPLEALGRQLKLPAWFEPHRAQIKRGLPPFAVRVLKEDQA